MQLTMRHFQRFRYRLPICGLSVLICLLAGFGSHIGIVHCLDSCGNSELEFALGGLCVRPGLFGNEQDAHAEHTAACAEHAGAVTEHAAACAEQACAGLTRNGDCASCIDPCGDCSDLSISGQLMLAQSGRSELPVPLTILAAQAAGDLLLDGNRPPARASIASFRPPPGQDPSHLQSSTILII